MLICKLVGKPFWSRGWLGFLTAAACLLGPTASQAQSPIKHVVLIMHENRTFDNLFGTFPKANGATSATISTGQVIPLGHSPDRTPSPFNHTWPTYMLILHFGQI